MSVQYALIGYSLALTRELDRLLPPRSVVIVEEPHVVAARDVLAETASIASVASVVAAPTQSEGDSHLLAGIVGRPPGLRAVVPTVEYGVVAAAALAEAWDLPGAGVRAARVLRDKLRLREVAAAAGIAQPRWREATGAGDVAAFRDEHDGRCVLKPANRQASLGVQLLGPDDDPAAAWVHTTAADEPRIRARHLTDARFVVESLLTGDEFSVEAFVRHGEVVFDNVTAKSVAPGRFPVELGHVVPAPVPAEVADALVDATRRLVGATGFADGIVHVEWIVADGTPHLVECAGRAPGDSIPDLIGLAYGTDVLADLLLVLDRDRPVLPPRTATRGAAIRFLQASPGRVTAVEDGNDAADLAGLRIGVEVGDQVGDLTNSWTRIGHVMTTADDAAEAERRALAAVGRIRVTTSPDAP